MQKCIELQFYERDYIISTGMIKTIINKKGKLLKIKKFFIDNNVNIKIDDLIFIDDMHKNYRVLSKLIRLKSTGQIETYVCEEILETEKSKQTYNKLLKNNQYIR